MKGCHGGRGGRVEARRPERSKGGERAVAGQRQAGCGGCKRERGATVLRFITQKAVGGWCTASHWWHLWGRHPSTSAAAFSLLHYTLPCPNQHSPLSPPCPLWCHSPRKSHHSKPLAAGPAPASTNGSLAPHQLTRPLSASESHARTGPSPPCTTHRLSHTHTHTPPPAPHEEERERERERGTAQDCGTASPLSSKPRLLPPPTQI